MIDKKATSELAKKQVQKALDEFTTPSDGNNTIEQSESQENSMKSPKYLTFTDERIDKLLSGGY